MKSFRILFILASLIPGFGCKKDPVNVSDHWDKVIVTTLAGEGSPSFENGPFAMAKFNSPADVVFLVDGPLIVTDLENHQIREIKGGLVSGFAGSSQMGILNGLGQIAQFNNPYCITTDAHGNLYSSDANDPRIRKITPEGLVSVYAGSSQEGFKDGAGDSARFFSMNFIVADEQGNVYVADAKNNRIRRISSSGQVTTFAGTGMAGYQDGSAAMAEFNNPGGIALDKSGNLFVIDRKNYRIRKITPDGEVTTIAGNGRPGRADGPADQAVFSGNTHDLLVDNDGNIILGDDHRIRKISPAGIVSTIAGSDAGFADGEGTEAKFNFPNGLCIDVLGNIFVADLSNNRIREIVFK